MITYILLVFVFIYNGIFCDSLPEVRISDGLIRGTYQQSMLTGKKFTAFEGIPYAKPPIGKRRFEPPESPKPWKGVWISRKPNPCLQYPQLRDKDEFTIVGHEDCLYLNVYSPHNFKQDSNYDVIVHIHGGAFMWGESTLYGPELLLEHDVVYVNINYRLGPLGFLSTEDDVVPGNNGMKDQVMALKWIKNNIHHFGGNPDSITITGLSAGGASVHYHYLSPMSRGLFKQGISMSGSVLNPWTLSRGNLEKAKKLADIIGCPAKNTKEMVECMKNRPATQIVATVPQFMVIRYNPFSPFGLVVEKNSKQAFLPDHPYKLLKSGQIQDLPWLTSVTTEEGLYPAAEFIRDSKYFEMLEKDWAKYAPHVLDYNYTADVENHKTIAEYTKDYYFRGNSISRMTFDNLVQMVGDRHFVSGSVEASHIQSKVTKSPVYFYQFRYRGKRSVSEFYSMTMDNYGVSHADDLYYILPGILQMDLEDTPMSEVMLNMWISFAKTSKPQVKNIDWEPVCQDNKKITYLDIESAEKISMASSDQLGNVDFWNIESLNEKEI